jgi:hypothetical protein
MNVRPESLSAGRPSLTGAEGELVSVSIAVEPRLLEELLEALADLPFPLNPEISHNPEARTIVEFPAYAGRLPEIRSALGGRGFDPASARTKNMLEQIRG